MFCLCVGEEEKKATIQHSSVNVWCHTFAANVQEGVVCFRPEMMRTAVRLCIFKYKKVADQKKFSPVRRARFSPASFFQTPDAHLHHGKAQSTFIVVIFYQEVCLGIAKKEDGVPDVPQTVQATRQRHGNGPWHKDNLPPRRWQQQQQQHNPPDRPPSRKLE